MQFLSSLFWGTIILWGITVLGTAAFFNENAFEIFASMGIVFALVGEWGYAALIGLVCCLMLGSPT